MIVIFRPQAVEDVIEAAAWYEAHAPGLGEQLIDEILTATHRAQENPELFRIVRRDGMFGALLQSVFLIGSSFRLSAKRCTFTQSSTAHATIVAGRNDCNRLLASSRPLNRELFLDRMK